MDPSRALRHITSAFALQLQWVILMWVGVGVWACVNGAPSGDRETLKTADTFGLGYGYGVYGPAGLALGLGWPGPWFAGPFGPPPGPWLW